MISTLFMEKSFPQPYSHSQSMLQRKKKKNKKPKPTKSVSISVPAYKRKTCSFSISFSLRYLDLKSLELWTITSILQARKMKGKKYLMKKLRL